LGGRKKSSFPCSPARGLRLPDCFSQVCVFAFVNPFFELKNPAPDQPWYSSSLTFSIFVVRRPRSVLLLVLVLGSFREVVEPSFGEALKAFTYGDVCTPTKYCARPPRIF